MRNTLRALLFFVLLAPAITQISCYSAKHVPADVYIALYRPWSFQIYSSVSAIPKPVRTSFAHATNNESFEMAEPGATWQKYDVDLPPGLPRRRLRSVAISDQFCFLFYEIGALGPTDEAAVFRLSSNGAVLVWHTYLHRAVATPSDLLMALTKGEFSADATPYL